MTTVKTRTSNDNDKLATPMASLWASVVLVSLIALTITALAITKDVPQTVLLLTCFNRAIRTVTSGPFESCSSVTPLQPETSVPST